MDKVKKKYKKVECPSCHNNIEYLINRKDAVIDYKFYSNKKYNKEPKIGDMPGMNYNWWICPICEDEIAGNEEDAIKFLRAGVLPKDYYIKKYYDY